MTDAVEVIEQSGDKPFQYFVVAGKVVGYFESDSKVNVDDMIEMNGGSYRVNSNHAYFHRTDGIRVPVLYTSLNLNANS
jgi:protein associated with RNAse G/E